MPAGMSVRVDGAAQKIEQIFRFDKELWKEIQKGVKDATSGIRSDAKAAYPDNGLGNWGPWITPNGRDLSYDVSAVKGGVRSSFRSRRTGGFRNISGLVYNKNAAGAIYGLAGSRNRSGEFFNTNINRKRGGSAGSRGNGTWPRALGPAWTSNVDAARREVARVVERAIDKVNR
jgi:hypothetical protein